MNRTLASLSIATLVAFVAAPSFAADVQATVKNGTLIVKGSQAADGIMIQSVPGVPGAVDIVPIVASATSVNGSTATFRANGVEKDVVVDLKGGADDLRVTIVDVRDVDLDSGDGADQILATVTARNLALDGGADGVKVFLALSSIERDLSISTEATGERIFIDSTLVGDDVKMRLRGIGVGSEVVRLNSCVIGGSVSISGVANDNVVLAGCDIEGKAQVRLGEAAAFLAAGSTFASDFRARASGNAMVTGTQCGFERDFRASADRGDLEVLTDLSTITGDLLVQSRRDTLGLRVTDCGISGDLRARLGSHATLLSEIGGSLVSGTLDLDAAGGDDGVSLSNVNVTGNTRIDGAGGDDLLGITNCVFEKPVAIDLGGGADQFFLDTLVLAPLAPAQNSVMPSLTVQLGAGDDYASAYGAQISDDTRFLLGAGDNVANLKGVAFGGNLDVRGGNGADWLDLTGATIGGAKHVDLGGGANTEIQ